MRRRYHREGEDLKDLHIMVTKAEHCSLKSQAAMAGHTLSRYCIKLLKMGKVEARLSPTELKLLRDVANAGNNINQIAHKLNSLETDRITIAMAEETIASIHKLLTDIQNRR